MGFIKLPVKGMCDFLPEEKSLREEILSQIKANYKKYGFLDIETPVMEHIENLCSKQGGENEKLIFKVLKRGAELKRAMEKGDELADAGMRYDLTVPLARYYANNIGNLLSPFKAMQIGSVWRADNPQKGRFRQFVQCDIDILGDPTNLAEIELIRATSDMLCYLLRETHINNFTVHINDRRILIASALSCGFSQEDISSVLISLDKLDKIGFDGVREELISKGFEANCVDRYLALYSNISEDISCCDFCKDIDGNYLSSEVTDNLNEIIDCVKDANLKGVKIVFDPTLVRGMGYYTGTIFEITVDGYNFSVAGGGRYDTMIGKFIGTDTPAVGFSIGFERIFTILKDFELDKRTEDKGVVFLAEKNLSITEKKNLFKQAEEIRENGGSALISPMKKNMTYQIDLLIKQGYKDIRKIYHKEK